MVNIFNRVSYSVHEHSGCSISVAGGARGFAAASGQSHSSGRSVAVGGGTYLRCVADQCAEVAQGGAAGRLGCAPFAAPRPPAGATVEGLASGHDRGTNKRPPTRSLSVRPHV